MDWFSGEAHRPFALAPDPVAAAGRPSTGALLIHGFMGTPKEMRPLGEALAAAGVAAHAPLLPGFGPQVAALAATRATDWVGHAARAWDEVVARHERTLLLGFSMGGAVALQVAARRAPDRLALLAPLWRLGDWPISLVMPALPALKHVVRTYSPFARANFGDPGVRQFFAAMDPSLDLADPAIQARLRDETKVSMAVIDELRRVATDGAAAAAAVWAPTVVLQGSEDRVVTPARTRALLTRFGGPLSYRELPADHLLVADDRPSWPDVRATVVGLVTAPVSPRGGLPTPAAIAEHGAPRAAGAIGDARVPALAGDR